MLTVQNKEKKKRKKKKHDLPGVVLRHVETSSIRSFHLIVEKIRRCMLNNS